MKFDKLVNILINEIFNTKKRLGWMFYAGKLTGLFKASNNIEYKVEFEQVEGNSFEDYPKGVPYSILKEIAKKNKNKELDKEIEKLYFSWSNNSYNNIPVFNLTFSPLKGSMPSQDYEDWGINNTGSSSEIFGIIINGLISLFKGNIKDSKYIKMFFFFAKEPSRISLYHKIAKILSAKIPFKYSSARVKDKIEGDQFYWVFYK